MLKARQLDPSPQPDLAEPLASWVELIHGGLPPAPVRLRADPWYEQRGDRPREHWRLTADLGMEKIILSLRLHRPAQSDRPCPVMIHGDGCWDYAPPDIIEHVRVAGWP